MLYEIRKAVECDLARVLNVYESARAFMQQHGNAKQWSGGYPQRPLLESDISKERLYVCLLDNIICGAFVFFVGDDPIYARIYDGSWLCDGSYGVIHRIAMEKSSLGAGGSCVDYCKSLCTSLRVDTHADNLPMQSFLQKNGFKYCGIIHLENGDSRKAYQWVK